jgi:hypothetical protein
MSPLLTVNTHAGLTHNVSCVTHFLRARVCGYHGLHTYVHVISLSWTAIKRAIRVFTE